MRLADLACMLLIVAALCCAQDTNFPVGPQYLITSGSPLLLRPIATPSLSFQAPPAIAAAPAEASAGEQTVYTPPRVPSTTDFSRIYWGAGNLSENAGGEVSEIEMTAEQPSTLPASIVNVGVVEVMDETSLRQRGYGVTLAEAAGYGKTHKTHASHVYTNADLVRLHGG